MKITEALLAEHAVFHTLFDHVERTVPRARTTAEVRSLAALVATVLAPHSNAEDTLLLQALDHCIEQLGQYKTFHEEHQQIEELLRLVQSARNLKQARQLLLAAITIARGHFDKEERIVFPLAEKVLKSRTLEDLGQKWREQRS
jgi:hemerythrin-like domain-containing protein